MCTALRECPVSTRESHLACTAPRGPTGGCLTVAYALGAAFTRSLVWSTDVTSAVTTRMAAASSPTLASLGAEQLGVPPTRSQVWSTCTVTTRMAAATHGKVPCFGQPGGSRTRCSAHKEPGMVDLHNKLCDHLGGCSKQPHFVMPGGLCSRCATHKDPGMVDLHSKRCNHADGCNKQPCFGQPGGSRTRCSW